ncbi:MAG: nickel pincer cofactor biosynthesis protein LarC [Proteobacteria bacterium]|nr:nickel pincer cofactor biosynthesis protein LarC [Pseudomonadota bacterium]MBI3498259.1 nickel pincer cofactor biosynthesis protein LarC [Pseudomonadota bacterium]
MHIHLDPVGGIAGDMFAAAMLNALPEHRQTLMEALAGLALPQGVAARLVTFDDGTLSGARFEVTLPDSAAAHAHDHGPNHDHAHTHRPFRDIRRFLESSTLPAAIRQRALLIFQVLAEAEAKVHGLAVDDVAFHEIGAWDSIVDIAAAAFLIERAGAGTWSLAPLPIGSGRVQTRHGELPVPPPAVALLLQGFAVFDDGRPGERVTPTGAAILRHLAPAPRLPHGIFRHERVGYGFGTKRFQGISNVLRVLVLDETAGHAPDQEIGVLSFEVDDQTPEDLAIGLDRLRGFPGVLDVLQAPAFGKKGRLVASIRVLAEAASLDAVAERCFAETTTIGVRLERVRRRALERETASVGDGEGRSIRVKRAKRPGGGVTAKAEMDDIAATSGDHSDRVGRRRRIERVALAREEDRDA